MTENFPKWSLEDSQQWFADTGWLVGCNFLPSSALNQVEMFQPDTFDLPTIERELSWASSLGFNALRVYLHDLLWHKKIRNDFLKNFNRFLDACEKKSLRCIIVFFDDCHWDYQLSLGPQQPRLRGVHNSGWLKSPGRKILQAYSEETLPEERKLYLRHYLQGVLEYYRDDPRIVLWDIYNEPMFPETEMLLRDVWSWAREVKPRQPLTGCTFGSKLNYPEFQGSRSDIISYHCYSTRHQQSQINSLAAQYPGRPIICTEYMGRPDSTFQDCLPILKENRVGAINWGLVHGKSGTVWRWPSQDSLKRVVEESNDWSPQGILEQFGVDLPQPEENYPEPPEWFHDIFRVDGSAYDKEEISVIRKLTERTEK